MGFSRLEYWSGLPFPSPEDLPDPGIKPRSPVLGGNGRFNLYIYIYIYMYVYIHTHIYVYIYTHTHIFLLKKTVHRKALKKINNYINNCLVVLI